MDRRVSKTDFKAHALEYFRQVEESGEPLVVTNHGKPVLEVRPYRSPPERSPLDLLRGSVVRFERPTDPVDPKAWEAVQ